jgi:hypothetical protein
VQAVPSAFWQVPPGLHDLHGPQSLLVQQTPSVQKSPVPHWSLVWHDAPMGFLPHVLFMHELGGTQSAFVAHALLHAVLPLHMKGAHWVVPPPTLQLPAPSQVFPFVRVEPDAGHDGCKHGVPACHLWHAPAPSQVPSVPQVAFALTAHWPLGSALPPGTGEHVPSVALNVHETQGPPQVALQHTPCAEHTSPEAHWLLVVHGPPLGSSPHEPLMQVAFDAQSALDVQVALQAATPHVYGKQDVAVGVTHLPAPSQLDLFVKLVVPAGQVGSRHFVPAAYFWQAPAAQRPFVPQLAAPWSTHIALGSTAPVGTFVHVPSVPGRPHDLHAAAQAVAQQKPCAHTFDAHSVLAEQGRPGIFLPHELPLHTLGATQLALVVQAEKHFVPLHAKGRQAIELGAVH